MGQNEKDYDRGMTEVENLIKSLYYLQWEIERDGGELDNFVERLDIIVDSLRDDNFNFYWDDDDYEKIKNQECLCKCCKKREAKLDTVDEAMKELERILDFIVLEHLEGLDELMSLNVDLFAATVANWRHQDE